MKTVDTRTYGRLLRCRRCSALVDAIEIDLIDGRHNWTPASEYVCDQHFQPIAAAAPAVRTRPVWRDMSDYDPATEPIPF